MRTNKLSLALPLLVILTSSFATATGQNRKPILVIFHGVNETRDDMRDLAQTSYETKMYSRVIVIGYNWARDSIQESAPRIFDSLNNRFPNTSFVLMGHKEGGLISEWIARRVKSAESRVIRVVSMNSPFDGDEASPTTADLGHAKDIAPNSDTVRKLKGPPLNDVSSVQFIRLWQRENRTVRKESALSKPEENGSLVNQLIVRTKPYSPYEPRPGDPLTYDEQVLAAQEAFDREKNYEEAERLANLAIAEDPTRSNAYSLLGVIHWVQGNHRKSEQAYLAALRRNGMAQFFVARDNQDWGWLTVTGSTVSFVPNNRKYTYEGDRSNLFVDIVQAKFSNLTSLVRIFFKKETKVYFRPTGNGDRKKRDLQFYCLFLGESQEIAEARNGVMFDILTSR